MTFTEALALKAEIDQAPGWLVTHVMRNDDGFYASEELIWVVVAAYWARPPDPVTYTVHHERLIALADEWPAVRQQFERQWPLGGRD